MEKLEVDLLIKNVFICSDEELEGFAIEANRMAKLDFGMAVSLYTPLYLSNYCENLCVYCGFRVDKAIERSKLSLEEVREELEAIYKMGIREVLLLTGEHSKRFSTREIAEAAKTAKKIGFKSVGIEVFPMSTEDYQMLANSGVNSLTLYQETYNRELYSELHLKGPKMDFDWRLLGPKRAAIAGISQINIGVLLGLGSLQDELSSLLKHLNELSRVFPEVEWGVSLPRLQEATSWAKEGCKKVCDTDFVKALLSIRLAFPKISIGISTRESDFMRRSLLPLGVNKLSAGVSTSVGGYAKSSKERLSNSPAKSTQFPIKDHQSVAEVDRMIRDLGYQPIYSNWV